MVKNTATAFVLLLLCSIAIAQQPDKVYMANINGVKFFQTGNQASYPVINLGSANTTEIHFDDLDGFVKNYNYTYLLCDADWQPADISQFDYIKGFGEGRFTQYYNSSNAKTRYVHYQATLPESTAMPTRSGNYLLLVYLDGDTSKLAFAERLMIVNKTIPVSVQVQHPFNQDIFLTHQKVQINLDVTRLNVQNPQQQLKVVVLQNYRWDNAITGIQPMIMRGNSYEYNGEQDCVFPAGKEYRWVNLESYRLLSERVESASETQGINDVFLKPDPERAALQVQNYNDYDGFFMIRSTEVSNPWWQGDYARVHFTFVPQNRQPYDGKDVYISGQLTGYLNDANAKMSFNSAKGVYEKTLVLKQGYYSYTYTTKDAGNPDAKADATLTDGNISETENVYTVLVYYRSFSDRADELVAATTVSSLTVLR
jgi:hypothetical protein